MTTEEIEVAEDRIPPGRIVLVGIGLLVSILIGVWVTYAILVHGQGSVRGGDSQQPEAAIQTEEISRVRTTMIHDDRAGLRRRRLEIERLDRYEWSDREKRTVRIPIERAMELRARGVRP
jgi:hypothetical protein